MRTSLRFVIAGAALAVTVPLAAQPRTARLADRLHPFGTLREQAARQQRWLEARLKTVLPALMRAQGVDMWIVPMREYAEDPVFSSMVSATTFSARRRTIYVMFDTCSASGRTDPGDGSCIERVALGGSSQGGVWQAMRSTLAVEAPVGGQQAELWGDEQWKLLKKVVEARNPKVIAINTSRTFAFADGLTHGEYVGMSEALGERWTSRFKPAEDLAVQFIASRVADEETFYQQLMPLVWELIGEMYSAKVIVPGKTKTSDLVWWWRQRVNDLGLGTWFQPSIEVQRAGATEESLGSDPVIQRGDVLHCDVGITALGLNTDTQHMAYVLKVGERDAPAGLKRALANGNALQDIVMAEIRPGRTGNEILAAARSQMAARGISGTVYSHPIGMHGHGSGPLIGLWDYQDGVPGRGDAKVIANMWFSIELQATSPVPEWNGQLVRMALEEDMMVGTDGTPRWVRGQQQKLSLVR
ncbi:MAG: aminopeptidase P family protein [Gemmatimonadaceae bacterium]|nr:aminopeptidase P family protein [Gemmatimonadaceae bacterium]